MKSFQLYRSAALACYAWAVVSILVGAAVTYTACVLGCGFLALGLAAISHD